MKQVFWKNLEYLILLGKESLTFGATRVAPKGKILTFSLSRSLENTFPTMNIVRIYVYFNKITDFSIGKTPKVPPEKFNPHLIFFPPPKIWKFGSPTWWNRLSQISDPPLTMMGEKRRSAASQKSLPVGKTATLAPREAFFAVLALWCSGSSTQGWSSRLGVMPTFIKG